MIWLVVIAATLLLGTIVAAKIFKQNLLLFAVPLGLVFHAWSAFVLSLALGFNESSVLLSAAIVFVAAYFLRKKQKIGITELIGKEEAKVFVFFLLLFAFLNYNLLQIDSSGNLVGNGKDLGFHLAIQTSIAKAGNFPPEYPVIAGEPLSYYYFSFFYNAMLERTGLDTITAFNLYFTLLLASLFSLFYVLARKFFPRKWSVVAVLLLLFSGGFAFLEHLKGFSASPESVFGLLANPKFYSQYESFGFPLMNFLLNMVIVKVNVAAIAAFFVLVLFLLKRERKREEHLLMGAFLGLLVMFNALLAAAIGFFLLSYAAFFEREKKREWAWFFAPAIIIAFLQLPLLSQKISSGAAYFKLHAFWMLSGENIAQFWLNNLGIPLLLGAAAIVFAKEEKVKKLVLAVIPLFVLINLFSFTPWEQDNFKLVFPIVSVLALASVAVLREFWGKGIQAKALVVLLFYLGVFTGYMASVSLVHWSLFEKSANPLCTKGQLEASEFIEKNTDAKLAFIGDSFLETTCLNALNGRKTFFSNNYWIENHGFDVKEKRRINDEMAAGDCALIAKNKVGYAYEDENKGWKVSQALNEKSVKIYDEAGIKVWRINC